MIKIFYEINPTSQTCLKEIMRSFHVTASLETTWEPRHLAPPHHPLMRNRQPLPTLSKPSGIRKIYCHLAVAGSASFSLDKEHLK